MRVILDTNVVISAVYFGGAPLRILSLRQSTSDLNEWDENGHFQK